MEHVRNWLLPAVLGVGWVGLSPSLEAWAGTPTREQLVVAGAASVVAAVALGFRRRTPLATLGVVTVVTVLGQFATSQDGVGVLPAELVALYSVAVRCSPVVGWRAVAVLVVVKTLTSLGVFGLGSDFALEAVGNLVLYVVILGGGHNRQRRLAVREQAAQELRDAEERRRNAAAAERHRLARELHDVSAHHLTSIVVSCGAAERLIDRRPELADEALEYAARTGRETLVSLRRLVAVLETGERDQDEPLGGRIAELAEAFTRLGHQVLVDVTPELSGQAAEAVFGIVRESLTNTLRHAPGAAVRVLVTRAGDHIHLLVENGRPAATPSAGQGSGRGIAGMQARAEAIGGTLTAAPGPDGNWQVRASLPSPAASSPLDPPLTTSPLTTSPLTTSPLTSSPLTPSSPAVSSLTSRSRPAGAGASPGVSAPAQSARGVGPEAPAGMWGGGRYPVAPPLSLEKPKVLVPVGRWRDRWVAEFGVVVAVTVPTVSGTAALAVEELPADESAVVGFAVLLALIPGLVLFGRRDRPWIVLAGVAASAWLWPLAIGLGWLPDSLAPALVMCVGAPLAAVYAVAAYGGEADLTWASVPAAAGGFGAAAGVLMLVTPMEEELSGPGPASFFMVVVAVAMAVPLLGCWVAGVLVRKRRSRRLDRGGRALAELVQAAEAEVHSERQRIATGLHRSVLTRTGRLIALAEAGQLEGVTAEARSALTAMRELLETLDEPGTTAPRTPHLTTSQSSAPQSREKELF